MDRWRKDVWLQGVSTRKPLTEPTMQTITEKINGFEEKFNQYFEGMYNAIERNYIAKHSKV
jgi:hypothetical protein